MSNRQEQETRILQLLEQVPESASWIQPSSMDQERLNNYERTIWTNIKNASIIEVGKLDTMYGVEAFRTVATLPQTVDLETLNEFRENGFVVRFVHPTIDVEEIESYMDDRVVRQPMVTMTTINYEPTEGLL
jgi:hypothetical protein